MSFLYESVQQFFGDLNIFSCKPRENLKYFLMGPSSSNFARGLAMIRTLLLIGFIVVIALELTKTSKVNMSLPAIGFLIPLSVVFLFGIMYFADKKDFLSANFQSSLENKIKSDTENAECFKRGTDFAFRKSRIYIQHIYFAMLFVTVMATVIFISNNERYKEVKIELPLSAILLFSFYCANSFVTFVLARYTRDPSLC